MNWGLFHSKEGFRAEPNKIILVGVGNILDVAYEFLKSDSPYDMVAFSVQEAYMASETTSGTGL